MGVAGSTATERKEARRPVSLRERASAFFTLTKPGITRLIVFSTGTGYYVASGGRLDWTMLHAVIGTALVCGGASALNEYVEREIDERMPRTRARPLPAGAVTPREAVVFAWAISLIGLVYLWQTVNLATVAVVAASLVSYVFLYTPLKRRTTVATLVGAIPGALPMMAGWTATGRPLELGAWVIFAIMFLWQIPHFLALAWLYREDYRAGGLVMLPVDDEDGVQTARQCFNYTAGLVPVSLLPSVLGLTGIIYFGGALLLGLAFLWVNYNVVRGWTRERARKLFFASITYLPLLFLLMLFDTVRS